MHIGIIPDGNRRWAKERRATTAEAYSVGFCNVVDVTLRLSKIGVEQITFFGLSNDNFTKRPRDQIEDVLSHVIDSTLAATHLLKDYRIRVRFYGQLAELGESHRQNLAFIENTTMTRSVNYISVRFALTQFKIILILLPFMRSWDPCRFTLP
jgi:tritrans,polycis-undecaprenyl-diphosphate synthase [geranylgeranyl-diphosphate specific]